MLLYAISIPVLVKHCTEPCKGSFTLAESCSLNNRLLAASWRSPAQDIAVGYADTRSKRALVVS